MHEQMIETAETIETIKAAEPIWEPAVNSFKKEAEPYPEAAIDRHLAYLMFVLAYLAVDLSGFLGRFENYGLGVTIFTLLYIPVILFYAGMKKYRISKEGWCWATIIAICGLSYTFVINQSLIWFVSCFLRLGMLYFPVVIFGAGIGGGTSEFLIFDGINMLSCIPFYNIRAQWKLVRKENIRLAAIAAKTILGILISLPFLFMAANLLASADQSFSDLLSRYSQNIGSEITTRIWAIILSLPLGCYLFGLIYGTANKRGTGFISREKLLTGCGKLAIVPTVSIYTALTGLCLLYMLFIYLQGNYFINAVRGMLPEGFTYSEFARRGFFELLELCLLNAAILIGVELFCKKKNRIIKGYRILVSALTLFLIGTAMTKMLLYIEAYGLTPLRVIPSVFMIYLAFLFLLLIVSQFKKLPFVKIAVCVLALGFSLLAVSDMNGRIAEYNLSRYQAGSLLDFPCQTLIECGPAAVPAIYQAWNTEHNVERKEALWEAASKIHRYDYSTDSAGWKYFNLANSRATACYEKMGVK